MFLRRDRRSRLRFLLFQLREKSVFQSRKLLNLQKRKKTAERMTDPEVTDLRATVPEMQMYGRDSLSRTRVL